MRNRAYSFVILTATMATIFCALPGCTDSNYDLGNIDKTIALGSDEGFSLPGNNSTSTMVFDDFIDLGDNSIVKKDNDGNYYISDGAYDNEVKSANPVIDEIPLTTKTSENYFVFDINESKETNSSRRLGANSTLSDIAKEIFAFDFENEEDFNNLDVLGISLAELKAGINIDFTFTDDLKANIGNLKKIVIDLPDYIDIEIESTYGEGKNAMEFDKKKNIISFFNITEEGIHARLKLNGLHFPPQSVYANKTLEEVVAEIADEYGYYLYYTPQQVSINGGIWFDAEYEEPALARSNESLLQQELKIHCYSHIDETIMLTSATGHFNPEIKLGNDGEPVGKFEIDDLPDFLDDEDVHLKIANPELRVWIESNMDVKGVLKKGSITAVNENGDSVRVNIDTEKYPIYINPHSQTKENGEPLGSTKTAIVITDNPHKEVKETDTYYGVTKDKKLSDLFYNIPKEVSFDCSVEADSTYEGTVRLGYKDEDNKEGWYKIQPSYEVYAPLAFNDGSVIIYRDSITDWHKDLKDITLSKGARVVMTADIVNRMPVDMKVSAYAIELNGERGWKSMEKQLINVTITDMDDNEIRIKAGTDRNPSTTRVKITLEQKDQQAFKRIDGICYKASAMGPQDPSLQGIPLNGRSQGLKVENIGVTLFGKVIVDID